MTPSRSMKIDFSTRLRQALAPDQGRLLDAVAEEAVRQYKPLYIVGGFVRDLVLGVPGLDFDLVVEGDAIDLARAVVLRMGGKLTIHPRFKTAQWFPPPAPGIPKFVDFTSARSEGYKHPAALPTVIPGSLTDDLHRRDFTINALAIRLDGEGFGELRDDLGGVNDIQAGVLRVLHPVSFSDDPTRLFRIVRYEQRYGFEISRETLTLIPAALPLIARLSAERVRHELDLTLEEEKVGAILDRLATLGILAAVHPMLKWNHESRMRLARGFAASATLDHVLSRRMLGWSLWLMSVPGFVLVSIDKRLHFDSGLMRILLAASALLPNVNGLAGIKASRCVAKLDKIPLKAVQAVALALPEGPGRKTLDNYLETWRHIKPKTTGHDLIKRGMSPGPAYKTILHRLREAWLDGEVMTPKEELVLLDKLTQ